MVFDNPVSKVQQFLDVMGECGTHPEFECFDVGIVRCVTMYLKAGMLKPEMGTPEYNLVMGVASGMPCDAELLQPAAAMDGTRQHLADHADRPPEIWPVHQKTADLGGMLRTGLEDTFYLPDGSRASGNGVLIDSLATCARNAGRTIASPTKPVRCWGSPSHEQRRRGLPVRGNRMPYQSIFAPALFEGQVIVVTGGGSGIGRCTAHELAALGARVVLVGRKLDKLQAVAAEIAEDGGKASTHVCDIRQEDAVRAMVAAVLAAQGHIDALVNNAGGQFMTPLEAISAKGWEAVVNTNLTGGFLVARECFTQCMSRQRRRHRQHRGRHVGLDAGHGPQRRGPRGHGQLHRDRRGGMGAARRARQRGGAGLCGVQRHGQLPRGHGPDDPRDGQDPAHRPLLHRGRGLRRHRLPAEPGGQLRQRHHAAHRCRTARRCAWAGRCARPTTRSASAPPSGPSRAFTAPRAQAVCRPTN
jgi:NAD(P)-dependent dehydrogenase (short-subunit alcohol dehydrogenase family)